MFIFKKYRKLYAFIFVNVFVCTLVINLYLLSNLRPVNYSQDTVNFLKTEKPHEIKNESSQPLYAAVKRACKVGNYSIFFSDLLLQLREDLEEFYSLVPNSTILNLRCRQFLSNVTSVRRRELILTDDQIDFTSKELVDVLKESPSLKVRNARKGTQLKLLIRLPNNITALFKPRWYSSSDIITGLVYSGKDRHYGEVIAFYLSVLLDLPRVPPAVIRSFDVRNELMPISDLRLLNTFRLKENETCFFGVCHYCSPFDLVCTVSGRLEGSLIYYLSSRFPLETLKHPWRRTYRCSSVARWETDENYCAIIRHSKFYSEAKNTALFLDLMDVAIFDFLIDNGDRHRFEISTNLKIPRLLMVDNGKSFGNPYTDHIDILAPLYQCCQLRKSTWSNLLLLRGGDLSKWLKFLLERSDGAIQINELHYHALDRRLLLVFTAMKYCFEKSGMENVLVDE